MSMNGTDQRAVDACRRTIKAHLMGDYITHLWHARPPCGVDSETSGGTILVSRTGFVIPERREIRQS